MSTSSHTLRRFQQWFRPAQIPRTCNLTNDSGALGATPWAIWVLLSSRQNILHESWYLLRLVRHPPMHPNTRMQLTAFRCTEFLTLPSLYPGLTRVSFGSENELWVTYNVASSILIVIQYLHPMRGIWPLLR